MQSLMSIALLTAESLYNLFEIVQENDTLSTSEECDETERHDISKLFLLSGPETIRYILQKK